MTPAFLKDTNNARIPLKYVRSCLFTKQLQSKNLAIGLGHKREYLLHIIRLEATLVVNFCDTWKFYSVDG